MIRTNIMLTEQQHALLKNKSRLRHKSIGELVRDAINDAFLEDAVERRRQVALAAYQEGLISVGKLAETLGLDPLSARKYLRERGVSLRVQETVEIPADATNA
jgi:predicted HTH domain antitoxin